MIRIDLIKSRYMFKGLSSDLTHFSDTPCFKHLKHWFHLPSCVAAGLLEPLGVVGQSSGLAQAM